MNDSFSITVHAFILCCFRRDVKNLYPGKQLGELHKIKYYIKA